MRDGEFSGSKAFKHGVKRGDRLEVTVPMHRLVKKGDVVPVIEVSTLSVTVAVEQESKRATLRETRLRFASKRVNRRLLLC